MNTYTESELVRLELLGYSTPEGLHPVERNWRDLARKLFNDVKELEAAIDAHHRNGNFREDQNCFTCKLPRIASRKFPEPFKAS